MEAECYCCKKTVSHLFCTCPFIVKKIWKPLYKWLDYYCNLQLYLSPDEILLQRYKGCFQMMVSTIILITKQYIYSIKFLKEDLSFLALIAKISHYKLLEEMSDKKAKKKLNFMIKSGQCMT